MVNFRYIHCVSIVALCEGIFSLSYGTSCIKAKPQPEIQLNGSFDEKFLSHYTIDGNRFFG